MYLLSLQLFSYLNESVYMQLHNSWTTEGLLWHQFNVNKVISYVYLQCTKVCISYNQEIVSLHFSQRALLFVVKRQFYSMFLVWGKPAYVYIRRIALSIHLIIAHHTYSINHTIHHTQFFTCMDCLECVVHQQ